MSGNIPLRRALRQALKGWQLAGVTHLPHPPARLATPSDIVSDSSLAHSSEPPGELNLQNSEKPVPQISEYAMPPRSQSNSREQQLQLLQECVAQCTRCQELASTRTQTVFGVGNPRARVMFIGEAPGADEDAQGEPFVGKAGQLLNKIIEACGWKRENIYICNILRCRPPGNRTPEKVEADNCREYLDGQIAIVDPEYIVCWGSCAAQNLLGSMDAIGKMRRRFYQHGRAKVLCTYHPSYLLRNPSAKKPVWEDMKFLLAEMGLKPPVA